jgi:hypothetical protein
MFTNRFFVPQNDRVERTVFTSFPPSEAPDFTPQNDRVERTVFTSFPPSEAPDFKTQHDTLFFIDIIHTFTVLQILKLSMTPFFIGVIPSFKVPGSKNL